MLRRGGGWIDSSHFWYVVHAHEQRLSLEGLSVTSIANPHVVLLCYPCFQMYTHWSEDVQQCSCGEDGAQVAREAGG